VAVVDRSSRAAYLDEVLRTLFPAAATPGDSTEYLVVPNARHPRLLVPARPRPAATAAVRRYAEPRSRVARLKRAAVAGALRTGTARWLLPDRVHVAHAGSVAAHLRQALGEPVILSIHIGPARANRKAVVQLLTPDGRTVGFAKVGTGPLTRRLVRAETAALATLDRAGLRQLTVPRIRHCGAWRGHEILVQSALPVWRRRVPLDPARLASAMREVALCQGGTEAPLVTSGYWAQLQERVAAVADRPDGAALLAAVTALGARGGRLPLRFGAWHGDWTAWNMAVLADTLLVWDWERFTAGVPLGFDALHYDLQQRVHTAADPAEALTRTLRTIDELLAPFGVAPPARETTALLYVADLAARYLTDRQAEAGARLGALGTWLLPVLLRRLDQPPP
jgi:hypothetical protein